MDRGFYSAENINALIKAHLKFIIAGKMNLELVRKELDPIYEGFRSYNHFSEKYELYVRTIPAVWEYEQDRPYKGDTLLASRRIYLHYYYNIEQAAEDEKAFDKKLMRLRNELETNNRIEANENIYNKYFIVTKTPKKGIKVTIKEKAVAKAKRYLGFFVLITNETMDAFTALELYRNKDVAEKAFGNLKERLNMRRMLVSSEQSLEGKLFVQFIALIYLSYIKKQMQNTDLFKKYTLQGLLDQLDLIECFEEPGRKLWVGEVLEKQKEIYHCLGITPPTSL